MQVLLTLFIALPLLAGCTLPPTTPDKTPTTTWEHEGFRVPFGENKFEEVDVEYATSDMAFYQYQAHVKFCKQPELDPTIQQAISDDGWLCEAYALVKAPDNIIEKEIQDLFGPTERRSFEGYQKETLNGHTLFSWRNLIGKSRLDHFVLQGDLYSYHFISSPYGDGDYVYELLTQSTFE